VPIPTISPGGYSDLISPGAGGVLAVWFLHWRSRGVNLESRLEGLAVAAALLWACERGGLVAVDSAGAVHNLARRIEGVKIGAVAGEPPAELPEPGPGAGPSERRREGADARRLGQGVGASGHGAAAARGRGTGSRLAPLSDGKRAALLRQLSRDASNDRSDDSERELGGGRGGGREQSR